MLAIVFVVTMLFWLLCFNKLMAISMNESLAASRHIRVSLINNLFAVVIALIVMLSIKWVGVLIINALLILPAAAARNISENIREYTWFSIVISLFSGVVGLVLSYSLDTATGPTIVIISAFIFFATLLSKRFVKG
jgi:zinc transport system permease protein